MTTPIDLHTARSKAEPASGIVFQSVRLHERCIMPIREQVLWLALMNDGAAMGPLAICTVILQRDRSALIQHLVVCDHVRRTGVGLALLEFLHTKYGPLWAGWTTKAGCALARKFDRLHGKQPWQIGCVRLPPKLEALCGPHETDSDLEFIESPRPSPRNSIPILLGALELSVAALPGPEEVERDEQFDPLDPDWLKDQQEDLDEIHRDRGA